LNLLAHIRASPHKIRIKDKPVPVLQKTGTRGPVKNEKKSRAILLFFKSSGSLRNPVLSGNSFNPRKMGE
jgi:hypothetical protein